MDDLLAVRLDLEMLTSDVTKWMITRGNDIPSGWTVISRHGNYVGLVTCDPKESLPAMTTHPTFRAA